jgi:hypothetical protein
MKAVNADYEGARIFFSNKSSQVVSGMSAPFLCRPSAQVSSRLYAAAASGAPGRYSKKLGKVNPE